MNGGGQFVPAPYLDPAKPIPAQLNKNNNNVNMPLPANLKSQALKTIASYAVLNTRLPSDPIFWPFHSFLLGVYERWRNY
jgi:hypothetical protein